VTGVGINEQAWRDAEAAAARGGLTVRNLVEHDELDAAREVWDLAWPSVEEGTQVTPNLLRAIEHSGGYVAGAYDDDQMVGAALAVVARTRTDGGWQHHLHSHLVATSRADRGVGTALKVHQRAWALDHDLPTVVWTFDPLVRRNARLNLVKLGGTVSSYLPDFYGQMTDALNVGDPSDRLLLTWDLASDRVARALSGQSSSPSATDLLDGGAALGLALENWGIPVATEQVSAITLVAVPEDIIELRRTDPTEATAWRVAMRNALQPLLGAGAVVTGLTVEGDYVVEVP
jgi:predicted GNAT superfamily acetyltransferase